MLEGFLKMGRSSLSLSLSPVRGGLEKYSLAEVRLVLRRAVVCILMERWAGRSRWGWGKGKGLLVRRGSQNGSRRAGPSWAGLDVLRCDSQCGLAG